MGAPHLERLARARDLLTHKGYDTSTTVLACYSGAGFHDDLRTAAARRPNTLLLALNDIYPEMP